MEESAMASGIRPPKDKRPLTDAIYQGKFKMAELAYDFYAE